MGCACVWAGAAHLIIAFGLGSHGVIFDLGVGVRHCQQRCVCTCVQESKKVSGGIKREARLQDSGTNT